jgi:hypothetical protein
MSLGYEKKRKAPRISVHLDVAWEGLFGKQKGTISDISVSGCYVLSSGEVIDGEIVKIIPLRLPDINVVIKGEVRHHHHDLGFGMQFVDIEDDEMQFLLDLIGGFIEQPVATDPDERF